MSNGFTYQINVQVVGANQIALMGNSLTGVEGLIRETNALLGSMNNRLQNLGSTARQSFSFANSGLTSFVTSLGLASATMSSLGKTADVQGLNNAIKFSGGTEGANNLAFVKKTVDDLKLPLEASLEGFKTLSGGLMGTGMTGKQTQDIFTSVAEGATVMGLKSEETKGALLALAQMASKGTVSAEELRGQLGERLPGAFGIAARAIGVTQQQLGKMLEQGQVLSIDFLPKFAAEMHRTFGPGVQGALNSARSNFNAFQNSLLELQLTFGEKIMPTVTDFTTRYLIPTIKFVGDHIDGILTLAGVLGGAFAAYKIAGAGMALYNGAIALAGFLTPVLTGEVSLLNAVMALNPVLLITMGLVALGGAVIYAWNHFSTFRSFMYGMWEVMKVFGKLLYDYAIRPLYALGEILVGVFTGNGELIRKGMSDGLEAIKANVNNIMTAAQQVGSAFTKGWNDGAKSFSDSNPTIKKDAVQAAFSSTAATNKPTKAPDVVKQKADGISGGGRQVRNITINVNKVGVDALTIQSTTITEGSAQMRDIIMRDLLQVINSANQVQ